jgi:hypothetical protein
MSDHVERSCISCGSYLHHEDQCPLNRIWKEIPPGMRRVTNGPVREGDYFYISELGAWGPVPRSGWGQPILNSIIARPDPKPTLKATEELGTKSCATPDQCFDQKLKLTNDLLQTTH